MKRSYLWAVLCSAVLVVAVVLYSLGANLGHTSSPQTGISGGALTDAINVGLSGLNMQPWGRREPRFVRTETARLQERDEVAEEEAEEAEEGADEGELSDLEDTSPEQTTNTVRNGAGREPDGEANVSGQPRADIRQPEVARQKPIDARQVSTWRNAPVPAGRARWAAWSTNDAHPMVDEEHVARVPARMSSSPVPLAGFGRDSRGSFGAGAHMSRPAVLGATTASAPGTPPRPLSVARVGQQQTLSTDNDDDGDGGGDEDNDDDDDDDDDDDTADIAAGSSNGGSRAKSKPTPSGEPSSSLESVFPVAMPPPRLSEPRTELASCVVGGRYVLFAGGITRGGQKTSRVDAFDAYSGTWTKVSLSAPRTVVGAAATGPFGDTAGIALFAGGLMGDGRSSDLVDILRLPTTDASSSPAGVSAGSGGDVAGALKGALGIGAWTKGRLSQARKMIAGCAIEPADYGSDENGDAGSNGGGKRGGGDGGQQEPLVLFGGGTGVRGQGSHSFSNVVDIYHAESGRWSTGQLSVGRTKLAAACLAGQAVFAGGFGPGGYSSVVDIYDARTGKWSTASLSQKRQYVVAAVAGGKAFFAAGYKCILGKSGCTEDRSDVVDVYTPPTGGKGGGGRGTWTTLRLAEARSNLAGFGVGNLFTVFAGGNMNMDPDELFTRKVRACGN
eukprot:jgi/Mesvir1/18162/Mv09459-RA.3